MLIDVVSAKYIKEYRIEVVFEDGLRGAIDFSEYLGKSGVFSRFSDPEFFKNFKVNKDLGTICWNNDIDVAPETLYEKLLIQNKGGTL